MDDAAPPASISYRLRREADGLRGRLVPIAREAWTRRWFRWLTYALAALLLGYALVWVIFARDLPSAASLAHYEPPLPTIVRDADGEPIYSYARERRVQLEYNDFPPQLIHAVLSAEDKNFFNHGGIDYVSILSAIVDNLTHSGRERGASTITQQVVKNVLLNNERTLTRKIREAILAGRLESVLTKQQILQIYLNAIPLGRQAFGMQAAAQAYFGKDVDQLTLAQDAFLASLPKAPEKYGRRGNEAAALTRRNWVLGEMLKNGWITKADHDAAVLAPLDYLPRSGFQPYRHVGGYFIEELRRELIDHFGETKADGPYSVYDGGLWVRSSLNVNYQDQATKALRDGLLRYPSAGWRHPITHVELGDDWRGALAATNIGIDFRDWRIAVTIDRSNPVTIGFVDGSTAHLAGAPATLKPGDVIAVAPAGGNLFAIRALPEVSGAMVVENPNNGRIYALQGGFDSRISSFDRATQAERQPGSTIKPFVYAAAIENGMTPATTIVDGPFCVWQSASLGQKCFRNFANERSAGPQTMRWGLEQSRNLMTVRAANDTGMPKVVKLFKTMGIGDYQPYLAFALGAGDTTPLRMINAYSILVNHGRALTPTLIDYAQDRHGNVVWPEHWRPCAGCNMPDWDGRPMPRFKPTGKQLIDPIIAYQVVHMLEGVIQRGTAVSLRSLDRPLMGKTGTTTGPTNVWFVGGTPQIVAGAYVGFDQQSRSLGGWAQGASIAAPIFREWAEAALNDLPKIPFTAPPGVHMVRIDRRTGRRVFGEWPTDDPLSPVIWEAFSADTEPKRAFRQDEFDAPPATTATHAATTVAPKTTARETTSHAAQRQNDFIQQRGGLY